MGFLLKRMWWVVGWLLATLLNGGEEKKWNASLASCVCDVNNTLTFLQVVPLSGAFGTFGNQYSQGLNAAFTEYNLLPNLGAKALLNLIIKNDQSDPNVAYTTVNTTLSTTDIFAVVGLYLTQSATSTYQLAVDRKVPFIGARTGVMTLREPFQRYVVNFRASYFDEVAAIVEHLLTRNFRCIAVFWQDDQVGQAAFDGITAALSSNSMQVCGQGSHTTLAVTETLDTEISTFLNSMTSTSIEPDVIILATSDEPAAKFIAHARTLWPNVFVAGLSCTNPDILMASLLNTSDPARLEHFVFTQLTPLLTDTSIPLVSKYKKALAVVDPAAVPSTVGIEGYLVGRLVVAALDKINGNFTREAFLDGLYENGFFNLDSVRCGPLLPSRVDGGCNQCMHDVMFVEPRSDGSLVYVQDNPSLHFSTCGYKPYEWTRLVFGQSCSYTGAPGQTCRDFRDGVFAAFKQVNDDGGVRGSMKLQLVTNDDLQDDEIAMKNNLEFLNDPSVFGLIGTSPHMIEQVMEEAIARNKPMFGPLTGLDSLRDPFERSVINFRAHQGDEITTIVRYCYYKIKITKVALLYENSTLGRDGKAQVEQHFAEKRFTLFSQGVYNYGEKLTEGAVQSIFFGPKGFPEAIIVIGFDDVLDEILLKAHSLDRNIYVFALSQVVMTELIGILTSSQAHKYLQTVDLSKLMFVQTVPVATDLSIPAVANYTAALASFNQLLRVSPAGLEGYLVGRLVATTVQRVMGKTISANTVVDAVYESGNFNLFGIHCGPYWEASDKLDGCNQCMKRTWLTGISNDGESFHLVDDSFSFTMCIYEPTPNIDFQLHGMRLIMVVIASVLNAVTLIVTVGLIRYRQNEHVRSSFKFSLISCVGALLNFSSVYLTYFIPTDLTCALEPWVADMSFVLLFGPLFSKTQRIDKIFNNKKMKKLRISDNQVFINFLVLLVVFVIQLIIWVSLSPRHMVESWTPHGFRYESCASPIQTFQYISWILKALVLIWGCFLCVRVYKITGRFARLNESKPIAVSIYNTTCCALVALVLGFTINDPNTYFMIFSSLLILNTTVVVFAMFVRPLVAAIRGIEVNFDDSDSSSSDRTHPLSSVKSTSRIVLSALIKSGASEHSLHRSIGRTSRASSTMCPPSGLTCSAAQSQKTSPLSLLLQSSAKSLASLSQVAPIDNHKRKQTWR